MTDEHRTPPYTAEPTALEPLLTIDATCGVLSISRQTLYELVRAGELHPSRVSERLRFQPDDIRAYLERNREPAA